MSADRPDLVVIGGGAAGLLGAWRAASRGIRVLLLEKNRRPGVKILASGGGRCNLTTTREGSALLRSFRDDQAAWLKPALSAFPPSRLRAWFHERGVSTEVEAYEKVFPALGRARVVLEALQGAVTQSGVVLRTEASVTQLRPDGCELVIGLEDGEVRAPRVLLACGGESYPKTGTTGDGYRWLSALGLRLTPRYPALVPLCSPDQDVRALAGLTLEPAAVELRETALTAARFEQPLLFTHFGLSGPGPMDVSGELLARGLDRVHLDLAPSLDGPSLDRALAQHFQRGGASSWLRAVSRATGLADRVAALCVARVGLRHPEWAPDRREFRRALGETLKGLPVLVSGTRGYDYAEVTRGGLDLSEVDPKTMAVGRVPGLYVAGELLDIDGPIGGFNFQAAFATGYLAGEAAARAVQR